MAANGGNKELDFKALYQSSLRLTTAIDDFGIPRLERNLEQLVDASRAFYQQQPPPPSQQPLPSLLGLQNKRPTRVHGKSTTDQANFLLASKGIDAEKLSKELQAFEIVPGFEQEPALAATDIEGFLTHHHEQIILSAIEDVHRQTMEKTQEHMNQAMIDDFERLKQQVLDDLGTSKQVGVRHYPRIMETLQNENSNVFANRISEPTSSIGPRFDLSQAGSFFSPSTSNGSKLSMSHLSGATESQLTEEMKSYYQVIRALHTSRTPSVRTQFDVAEAFQRVCTDHVSTTTIGSKWEAVLKCWQVVTCMIKGGVSSGHENHNSYGQRQGIVGERAFASAGQDDVARVHQQQRFAYGARLFLEKQFRAFVQQTVQTNQLPVGGIPDLVSNVRAFVKFIQSSSASTSMDTGEVDIWALLYYCLRCGGEHEAIQLASSYLSATGTSPVDESVLIGLHYRDQVKRSMVTNLDGSTGTPPPGALSQLFPNEYSRLVGRYQRLTSTSVDAIAVVNPYERSVLNLLCFGNPNASEPRILTTIEDYLWQRLSFIQRGASPDSTYTIARLAKSIRKFGPSHFEGPAGSGGSQTYAPFLFFEILLITQAFDQAITYLSSRGFILEAVHFAIALHYYGLLSVGDEGEQVMEDEDEHTASVDLVRLVRQYIHGFQRTNAVEAAEYIACLSDSPAMNGLLIDLILESRKFDALVGFTNNTDGSRTPGAIDRLLSNSKQDVRELILTAARKAEERGNLYDAITLLKAAGDMEGVISVLNTQLGSTLSSPRAEREEWFRVAKEFTEKWMRFPWVQLIATKYARTAAVAFQALLNISIFLEMYEQGRSEEAIRFVDELEIIPTPSLNNLDVCVDRFLVFDETVRRNFHMLLLSYVECLVRDTERVKVQTVGEVRRVSVATLREKAELVNTFANMIKFRLPQGTMERLNRMEAMIY